MPADERPPPGVKAATLLSTGTIEVEGRMPWSSNGTFLVTVSGTSGEIAAIYKPARAERPLWDFPGGLYRREVAAYELAEAIGWELVPVTVEVDETAPLGSGSLQLFVDADFEQHYFTLLEADGYQRSLRRMAAFDVIANNADRKSGHCLVDRAGHVWGIDHGLCFHSETKLRTVIWDFAGEPLDDEDLGDLRALDAGDLDRRLARFLRPGERAALLQRLAELLSDGRFPYPTTSRPYPWPLV
ncbi:MAG: SCO1664 family protein [Acidimicrobiales bacterium]